MNNVETTMELHGSGMNCAQAILAAFGKQYGLDSEMAKKLGRTLGGGIGHMAGICGALTPAALILGLAIDRPNEKEARKVSHESVQELFRQFNKLHGSTECKDLLGADMGTEQGMKKIQEEQLVKKRCPGFVRDAATILDELLASTESECASCANISR